MLHPMVSVSARIAGVRCMSGGNKMVLKKRICNWCLKQIFPNDEFVTIVNHNRIKEKNKILLQLHKTCFNYWRD